MNQAISISLFRVSSDSQYLDMIFDCPRDYYFNYLQLEVRSLNDKGEFISNFFDLSPALFKITPTDDNTVNKQHWTVRLPLEKLGFNNVPAIYKGSLKAEYKFVTGENYITEDGIRYALPIPYHNSQAYEIIDDTAQVYKKNGLAIDGIFGKILTTCDKLPTESLQDSMICSDVNSVYTDILNDILAQSKQCEEDVSGEAIKKYLLLYGHHIALTRGDLDTAEAYFKLLINHFSKCGTSNNIKHSHCNCGRI